MKLRQKLRWVALAAGLAAVSGSVPARAASPSLKAQQFTSFLTPRQVAAERRLIITEMRIDLNMLNRALTILDRQLIRGKISMATFTADTRLFIQNYNQQIKVLSTELASLTPIR